MPPNKDDKESAPERIKTRSRTSRFLRESIVIVIVALLLAFLARTYVAQTFFIPSASMTPTLKVGDHIVVDKLSYHLHGISTGDIVVFAKPPLENCGGPPIKDLVKRVIGLPGQTISLRDGRVLINGKILPQPWLPPPVRTETQPGPGGQPYSLARPYTVPAGEYFMMGDNRQDSCDSRYWGPVPRSLIVGKVVLIVWPLSDFKFF